MSENIDFLEKRIFDEINQVTTNYFYAEILIDKQIINSKWFNIIVGSVSTGGALLGLVDILFPIISSSIAAISLFVNQLHPIFFLKTEDVIKLTKMLPTTRLYKNELMNLYDDYYSGRKGSEKCQKLYTTILEKNAENVAELSRLFGKTTKKITELAQEKSTKHLNTIYH